MSPSFSARLGRRNPVHDFLVDRRAHRPRKSPVSLERRPRVMLRGIRLGEFVEFFRCEAWLHHRPHLLESAPDDQPGLVHFLELGRRFTDDHLALLRASRSRRARGPLHPRSPPRPRFQGRPGACNTPPAASSAARTPPAAPSRLPAGRRHAAPACRRRRRKFRAPWVARRTRYRSRRPRCTSIGP